jgi:hypothetical protein
MNPKAPEVKHSCACSNNRNAWKQAFCWVKALNGPKPVPQVSTEPEVTCKGLEPTETK